MIIPKALSNKKIVIWGNDRESLDFAKAISVECPHEKILLYDNSKLYNFDSMEVNNELTINDIKTRKKDFGVICVSNYGNVHSKGQELGLEEGINFFLIPQLNLIRIYTTNICNASCAMCDIGNASKKGIDRLVNEEDKEIKLSTIKKLLQDPILKERKIKFSLGMVEPLIHQKTGEIVRMIYSKGHSVAVITNGILLEKKAKELIDSKVDYVMVSIDGTEDIHDKIRGKKGIYRKAINGIKALHQINPELKIIINYTVFNWNYNVLLDFVRNIENEKIKAELRFQHMYYVSEAMAKRHNEAVNNKTLKQTLSIVNDNVIPDKVDINILYDQIKMIKNEKLKYITGVFFRPDFKNIEEMQDYYDSSGKKLNRYDRCFFPYNQVSVKTNGDVVFHSRCYDYTIGNVLYNDLTTVFNNDKANDFRKYLKEHDYCFPACTRCCGIMGGWQHSLI